MGLREHEKFWAFETLVFAIVLMALIARFTPGTELASALRDAIIGLIGIAGAAGQSLFRSNTERDLTAALKATNDNTVKPVEVVNTPAQPVPVAPEPELQLAPEQEESDIDPIFRRNG